MTRSALDKNVNKGGHIKSAIVKHIDTGCAWFDAIIAKFRKQIELFKEYRTTLISEVVTGKIDVREA